MCVVKQSAIDCGDTDGSSDDYYEHVGQCIYLGLSNLLTKS